MNESFKPYVTALIMCASSSFFYTLLHTGYPLPLHGRRSSLIQMGSICWAGSLVSCFNWALKTVKSSLKWSRHFSAFFLTCCCLAAAASVFFCYIRSRQRDIFNVRWTKWGNRYSIKTWKIKKSDWLASMDLKLWEPTEGKCPKISN